MVTLSNIGTGDVPAVQGEVGEDDGFGLRFYLSEDTFPGNAGDVILVEDHQVAGGAVGWSECGPGDCGQDTSLSTGRELSARCGGGFR